MAQRGTRSQKRKREDEDYEECHIEDGDAGTLATTSAGVIQHSDRFPILPGRTAVKSKSNTSKARPITIKKRHEKQSGSATVNKYVGLKIAEMRELLKPLRVRGMGTMRKDELLQTCLLFDSDLSGQYLHIYTTLILGSWILMILFLINSSQ